MLSVCTKGLRVTQFRFSVCMYGTCGRTDNKADFDFDLTLTKSFKGIVHPKIKIISLITHPHVIPNYFKDVVTTFLGLECVSCIAVYAGSESFQISSEIS